MKESTRFVCSYRNYGPYYEADSEVTQVNSLTQMIYCVRNLMEDGVDYVAVFDSSWKCTGLWIDDSEPEPDGEGGWLMPHPAYVLHRPDTKSRYQFDVCVRSFRRPAALG